MIFQNKITSLIKAMRHHIAGKRIAPVDSEDLKRLCDVAEQTPPSADMSAIITAFRAQAQNVGVLAVLTDRFTLLLTEAEKAIASNPSLDDHTT